MEGCTGDLGKTVHGEAFVRGGVGVVLEGDALAEHNEDGREEERQGDLHQSHQDLTLLEREERGGEG